jgi:hypothetical protein
VKLRVSWRYAKVQIGAVAPKEKEGRRALLNGVREKRTEENI